MIKNLSPRSSSQANSSTKRKIRYDQLQVERFEASTNKVIFRKKRYIFQILKQFILFPNQSSSSEQTTMGKYDKLVFDDDLIHGMFKILQTKFIQDKIWGFINLRAMKYKQQIQTFQKKVHPTANKIQTNNKQAGFNVIKKFSFEKKQAEQLKSKNNKLINMKIEKQKIERQKIKERKEIKGINSNNVINSSKVINISSSQSVTYVKSDQRQRERSRSITRLQYSIEDAQRILLSGKMIPVKIEVRRSVSPARQPEYRRVSQSPSKYSYQKLLQSQHPHQPYAIDPHQPNSNHLKYQYQNQTRLINSNPRLPHPSLVYTESPSKIIYRDSPSKIIYRDSPSKIIYRDSPSKIIYRDSPSKIIYINQKHCCHQRCTCCHCHCCHCCHCSISHQNCDNKQKSQLSSEKTIGSGRKYEHENSYLNHLNYHFPQ